MPLLDKLREQYGVGPLCSELHIAPSTYYHCQQQRHHPDKRSARAQRDDWLKKEIQRVYDENHKVYGVRKVWRQLLREGIRVARCTVARLMAVMGLAGVLRGKKVRTTISRKAVAAGDRVNLNTKTPVLFYCSAVNFCSSCSSRDGSQSATIICNPILNNIRYCCCASCTSPASSVNCAARYWR